MFNKLSTILIAATAMLINVANATEIKINRHLKYTTTEPLLYEIVDLLPKIAEKNGVKDLKVSFVDIQEDPIAVQEMLIGNVDVIIGGVSSFAYAWNKDPSKIKLLSGAETFDMWLFCSNPSIKSIKDIGPNTKITIKGLNSGDHMMLREYTIAAFGIKQSEKFTNNLVVVPRDQAFVLHSADKRTVDCGIIGSPYQNQLVSSDKAHIIAKPDNKITFGFANAIYATNKWIEQNPQLAKSIIEAENIAISRYNESPLPVLSEFIIKDNVDNISAFDVKNMKKENNDIYDTSLTPAFATIKLMYDTGMIEGPNSTLPQTELIAKIN
jgi:NitT/TauT family transport system substrate-binding protein